ncbi:MAG: hypothetical protein F6K28_23890 [Microcoleus sp. SIO2G3]|nr:hypothetical protein [Microcoleus sp. SIO2G3]
MSQNTPVESSRPSINPTLQAALGSFDVQLEEELARYRRQRSGRPIVPTRGLGRNQSRKPIELIPVDNGGESTPLPASRRLPPSQLMPFPLTLGNQTPGATPAKETQDEPTAQQNANSQQTTPQTTSSLTSEGSANEQLTPPREPAHTEDDLAQFAAEPAQPEDYLESSEQLLRSLGEEEADIHQPRKRFTDRLLTPLGVGSVLLLLLSSATVAYIITNPYTLSILGFNKSAEKKTTTIAQSPTQTTEANSEVAKETPVVKGPDLASDEFVDVNISNLSRLEASPAPATSASPIPPLPDLPSPVVTPVAPSAVPNPVPPRGSSDLSSTLLPPAAQSGVVPPPLSVVPAPASPTSVPPVRTPSTVAAKPQPSVAPASPSVTQQPEASPSQVQVAANATPSKDNYYYVLLNDGSESTLQQARTIVPDAYTRDFPQGTRVQMGAFKVEAEAKSLVAQLQQQGISASIYRP